jgi:hypothetical protein
MRAPDATEIPPLPQDNIPLLQPQPKHPAGSLRYVPPAVNTRGVFHNTRPASYAGSSNVQEVRPASLPAQSQVSQKQTEIQSVVGTSAVSNVEQSSVVQSYHPPPLPPLTRARTSESNVPRIIPQRALETVNESHPTSHFDTVNINIPQVPPPPPPKIPLPSLVTHDLGGGDRTDVFSPSNYPLPQSATTAPVPALNQGMRDGQVGRSATTATPYTGAHGHQTSDKTAGYGSIPRRTSHGSASAIPPQVLPFQGNNPRRQPSTSGAGASEVYELPATNGHDDEPVMMAVSYPGDEWIPEWNGMD